jgi:hypothetical protein
MRHIRAFIFLFSILFFPAFSQVTLSTSITSGILPNDTDPIAAAPTYIDTSGQFMLSGLHPNMLVPEFTLYDTLGNPTTLSTTLNLGKPVLLVSVSLSCPSSRHCIPNVLGDIIAQYGNQINILLIYIVEAHPLSPDFSPYANSVWEVPANVTDSALLHQEATYGQRKQECAALINRFGITIPVLMDGTSNEYWNTFGPAPNNAYLLTSAGVVYQKYGWFDQSESALMYDIPMLLVQTGIPAYSGNSSAQIFPNPSNGNTALIIQNESSYNFRIVDMAGRIVVAEENVSSAVSDLEKYHLDAGSYSVIVEAKSGHKFSLHYIVR